VRDVRQLSWICVALLFGCGSSADLKPRDPDGSGGASGSTGGLWGSTGGWGNPGGVPGTGAVYNNGGIPNIGGGYSCGGAIAQSCGPNRVGWQVAIGLASSDVADYSVRLCRDTVCARVRIGSLSNTDSWASLGPPRPEAYLSEDPAGAKILNAGWTFWGPPHDGPWSNDSVYSLTVTDLSNRVVVSRRTRAKLVETFAGSDDACGRRSPCVYVVAEDLTPDATGSCAPPDYLAYRAPGCDGAVGPVCVSGPGPAEDAGLTEACSCDGESVFGGRGFMRPYRHLGECKGAVDSGTD